MKTAILILPIFAFSLSSFALNELGALDDARAKNPAVFVSGNVLEYTVEGVSGYVFNGESEQCFTGDMAETDSELYQEAVLDAKSNLRKYLAKRTKAETFQLSGVRKLYEYKDGKMRRVVLFVAKGSVIARPVQPAPAPSKQIVASPIQAVAASNEKSVESQKPGRRTGAEATIKGDMLEAVSPNETASASGNAASVSNETASASGDAASGGDRISVYLKQIEDDPTDCITMSKAAKTYARRGNISEARALYERIAKVVLADEKMDKEFASGLLVEAARFERDRGDLNRALKYYRLLIRCDGLRRWRLHELVDEANRNISSLLLKVD